MPRQSKGKRQREFEEAKEKFIDKFLERLKEDRNLEENGAKVVLATIWTRKPIEEQEALVKQLIDDYAVADYRLVTSLTSLSLGNCVLLIRLLL